MQRYGSDFVLQECAKYPTANREELFPSLRLAAEAEAPALSLWDKTYGKGASEFWLRIQLVEVFKFVGAYNRVSAMQIKRTATIIRQRYYFLTPPELMVFFSDFEMGRWQNTYGIFNPQSVLSALKDYALDVQQERGRIADRKEMDRISALVRDPNNISFEEYVKLTDGKVSAALKNFMNNKHQDNGKNEVNEV